MRVKKLLRHRKVNERILDALLWMVVLERRQTLHFQRGETTLFSEENKRNRLKCILEI